MNGENWHELWDVGTGNRIAAYQSRVEALAAVQAEVSKHGAESPEVLSLALVDQNSESKAIVGKALVTLALSANG